MCKSSSYFFNVISFLQKKVLKLFNTIYFISIPKEKKICINSCMSSRFGKVNHLNWGDDLNFYIVQELSGKVVINYPSLYHWGQSNIMVIGSIIDWMSNKNSIVWGSGAVTDSEKLREFPREIRAVRGKLTRNYLLNQGIYCPAVFGDPALLLPLIYKPNIKKKYKMGIIPHYVDNQNEFVLDAKKRYGESIVVINMKEYVSWQDIIDTICQCDFIASSSLHGIIASDAYKIPNVWIRLSNNITGGNFKFHDYFSGVGRELISPVVIDKLIDIEKMRKLISSYEPINYSYEKLLESCPFEILSKYR